MTLPWASLHFVQSLLGRSLQAVVTFGFGELLPPQDITAPVTANVVMVNAAGRINWRAPFQTMSAEYHARLDPRHVAGFSDSFSALESALGRGGRLRSGLPQ